MTTFSIFKFNHSLDRHEIVRFKFLQFFYITCAIFIPFFIIKNNIQYGVRSLNWVSIPLYVGFLLAPLYARLKNDYFKSALLTVTMAALNVSFLIFEAGGLDAPGLVWLAAIPVTYAIALGRRGVFVGSVFLLCVLSILKYIEVFNGPIGIIQFTDESYRLERLVDMIGFAIYIIFTTHYYVHNEELASNELQSSRNEVETLLRTVMHDIATPITVCTVGLSMLQRPNLKDEDKEKAFRKLSIGLDNITKILSQIRFLKSMQDGKTQLITGPLNVNNAISLVLELLETSAAAKKINFVFQASPVEPLILVDQVIFKNIIISNFLTNAIKFSNTNGNIYVAIEATADKVVRIKIRDEGIGVPQNILQNIWRIDQATSRPGTSGEKGTGYGMPLAKEFAEKMGGKIEMTSSTAEEQKGPSGTEVIICFNMI